MTGSLFQRIEANAAQHPHKPAFIHASRSSRWEAFTFKHLLDASNRLARGLQFNGLHEGMRAAVMVPPSREFFALALALLKTGIIPVLVDPAIGLANVTKCLSESKPDIFIGNSLTHALRLFYGWGKETIQTATSISKILERGGCRERVIPASGSGALHFISGDSSPPSAGQSDTHEAAVIYTSGSTGLPKGAVYSHENFSAQLDMLVDTFDLTGNEIDLPAFPLFALIDCLLGVTAVIPDIRFPVPARVNPRKLIRAIDTFNVDNMFASPIVLDKIAQFGVKRNIKLPSLKRVITAGAPAPVRVLEEFWKLLPSDASLFGIYGATEALPISVIDSREILNETRHKSAQGAGVCIGRPVHGMEVRIVPAMDDPIEEWRESLDLEPNQIGEITVKGRAVTQAYIARPESNRPAKIRDGHEIIHRTGDVGYFDEQGRLWYCGRKSHRVVSSNETFFTENIEGIFNAHPLVYRTALVGVNGQAVLWVQLEGNAQNADKEKIGKELFELGAGHPQASKIKTILFRSSFPTDVRHNSKIIREELTLLAQKALR